MLSPSSTGKISAPCYTGSQSQSRRIEKFDIEFATDFYKYDRRKEEGGALGAQWILEVVMERLPADADAR